MNRFGKGRNKTMKSPGGGGAGGGGGGDAKRSNKRTLKSKEQIVKTRIKDDTMNKIRNKFGKKKGGGGGGGSKKSGKPNNNNKPRFRPGGGKGKRK